jgi:predicted dehydrogenase
VAVELIALAAARNLKLTAGHDDQFTPVARRLRAEIQGGYLGGDVVHMESYYGYEMGGQYVRALLGDRNHWVRKLPGQLLQNVISHGIARVAEHLHGDQVSVHAQGTVSPFLQKLGERELIDELRVILTDARGTTAYFTFSSQMRPCLHQFRVYGPKNGLQLDEDDQTLLRLAGKRFPSHAARFIPPWVMARQCLGNWTGNFRLFLRREFHMKAGMKHLIESFYHAVNGEAPLPIPYREILLTARIMDQIFSQLATSSRPDAETLRDCVSLAPSDGEGARVRGCAV